MAVKIEKHIRENTAQWHYNLAVKFWWQGKWDKYAYHARIGDRLLGVRHGRN